MLTLKQNIFFLLLTASLFIVLLIIPSVQYGMFLDGITYAAIAKNLANNMGTLWAPYWTQTGSIFYEHPPLAIYLESLFFRILGQSFWVEKVYSLTAAIINIIATLLIWKNMTKTKMFSYQIWIPLLLWLLVPINAWCYKNNLLECTATCFSTLAFLCLLTAQNQKYIIKIALISLASSLIFLGFVSNGPASLFPLVTPIIYYLVYKSGFRIAVLQTVFLILLLLCSFIALFMISPAALHNIKAYLLTQLMPAVTGNRSPIYTAWKHLHIFIMILQITWPILLLSFMVIYLQHYQNSQKNLTSSKSDCRNYHYQFLIFFKNQLKNKTFIFYLLIGLSASLPIGISHKQTNYYLLQACPFYMIAVGSLVFHPIREWTTTINTQKFIYKAVLLFNSFLFIFLLASIFLLKGNIGRDSNIITDVDQISAIVPENSVVSATTDLTSDWYAIAYFERRAGIRLDANSNQKYLITYKNQPSKLKSYKLVTLPTKHFNLYKQLVN